MPELLGLTERGVAEHHDSRRFGMMDGMILIGFTGLGFGIARPQLTRGQPSWLQGLALTFILLVCWTIAALILRLRRPRPRLSDLTRQPGAAGTIAALSVLTFAAIPTIISVVMRISRIATLKGAETGSRPQRFNSMQPDWLIWLNGAFFTIAPYAGAAVLGTWVTLALSGRRRPEPSWIDYFARILGGLSIAAFAAKICFDIINRYRF